MFTKFAKAEVIGVRSSPTRVRSASLTKFADFNEYRTDDGYVYVRVRAISSRVNKNHDGWPSKELEKAYRTFIGKPIFVDHHNSDPKKARGVIVDAQLHVEDAKTSSLDPYYSSEGVDPSHLPATWIELLLEVDAKRFPRLAKAVVAGEIDGVSMGANVESSVCSHCGNTAYSPEEFCKHIISKGAYFDYALPNGLKISKRSYENCHGVGFFEISFVFDPADETALVSEVKHTARRERIAAIHAEAALDLPDPGMEEMVVPDPPVGYMEGEGVPQVGEAQKVHDWRLQQLLNMGFPEDLAKKLAPMEFRGEGKGVDLHQLQYGLDNGMDHQQAFDIYSKTANKYIKKRGDKWVIIQKGTGKVLSEHDSEEKANSSFRAMEMHKHEGSVKTAEDRNNQIPQSMMTSAPEKVDTLRQEQICPVCGSSMEDGECEVCNYVEPPEGFDNPDLEKAKQIDEQIHDQQADQAQQTPPEEPLPNAPLPEAQGPSPAGSPALASFFHMPVLVHETRPGQAH